MARFYFSFFSSRNCPLGKTLMIFQLLLVTIVFSSAIHAQSNSAAADQRVQELYAQAKAAEARGELGAAVASYESLLQIAPRLGPAYNNLRALYLKQHEYRKAATILARRLNTDPKLPSPSPLPPPSTYP